MVKRLIWGKRMKISMPISSVEWFLDKKRLSIFIIHFFVFIWIINQSLNSFNEGFIFLFFVIFEVILLSFLIFTRNERIFFFLWSLQLVCLLLFLLAFDSRQTFGEPLKSESLIIFALLIIFCEVLLGLFLIFGEKHIKKILIILTLSSALFVVLIVGFIANEGLSTFEETSIVSFITSDEFNVFYEEGATIQIPLDVEFSQYNFSFDILENPIISQVGVQKNASIIIRNTGANEDEYSFSIIENNSNVVFYDSTINLEGNSVGEANFSLFFIEEGIATVTIECRSASNITKTLDLDIVTSEKGIELSPKSVKAIRVGNGDRVKIPISLTNTGESDEKYLLSIENFSSLFRPFISSDNISWNYSTFSTIVEVNAGETTHFKIFPNILSYYEGEYDLTLKATCISNDKIIKKTRIHYVFTNSLLFMSEEKNKSISNDESCTFVFNVSKNRDGPHIFRLNGSDELIYSLWKNEIKLIESDSPIEIEISSDDLKFLELEVSTFSANEYSRQEIVVSLQEPPSAPPKFGIGSFILGTFITVLISVLIAVPLGLGCAIFLAEYCPFYLHRILRPIFELIAGIPSILIGVWGAFTFAEVFKNISIFIGSTLGEFVPFLALNSANGRDYLTASVVLSIMILPIIITLSEDSIKSVSRGLKEGSLAMGATRWETMRKIIMPTAKSGILSSIILSIGRAIGETMAVLMIMSFSTGFPNSLFDGGGTMTTVIAKLLPYVAHLPKSQSAMFAIALVLFILIFILNIFMFIVNGYKKEKDKKIFRNLFSKILNSYILLAPISNKKFTIIKDEKKEKRAKNKFLIINENEIRPIKTKHSNDHVKNDVKKLKSAKSSEFLPPTFFGVPHIFVIGVTVSFGLFLSVLTANFIILALAFSTLALIYALLPHSRIVLKGERNHVDTSSNKQKSCTKKKDKKASLKHPTSNFSIGVFSGPSWFKANNSIRKERIMVCLIFIGSLFVTFMLFYILSDVIVHGIEGFKFSYLYEVEIGAGGAGGFLNAITGSLQLLALSIGIAFPLALGSAIYIQEYAKKDNIFTRIIMFASDTLASTPSIVFGAFGFIFFVKYIGFGVSLLAGGLTLACMALPLLLRSCIEAIKAIPFDFQEGSLALGASKWQTIVKAVIPPAMIMISSGVIISMGRVIGETAAVMFAAGYLSQVSTKLLFPIASLPIMIWQYFQYGPTNEIIAQKMYSASLVLILIVILLNASARIIGWRFGKMMKN